MNDLQQHLSNLCEEIQGCITEHLHISQWELLKGYHTVGKLITEFAQNHQYSNKKLVQLVAQTLHKKERTLQYAVKYYTKYPDINKTPEGKAIHWKKLITQYLTDGEKKEIKWEICDKCGSRYKKED